jgi:hypothetical protein
MVKKVAWLKPESANREENALPPSDPRIPSMHRRDVASAWIFVIGLWFAIFFVLWGTWDIAPSSTARTVLLIGGLAVLVFNTAAILAMLAHYREDRDFIYGLDLKFSDASRDERAKS